MTEESLFHAALAKAPAERVAFLEGACLDNPERLASILGLIKAHESGAHLLDIPIPVHATQENTPNPAGPTQSYTSDEPTEGVVIAGRYCLEQKLGEGGMGEVWVARQSEPVKRKVALKLIKAGMDSRSVVQRFEQERQALAMMDHPNIAKVLDGGLTEDRRPFFVMELVNGLPLNKFCDDAKLGIKERLELFIPICQAVQHAHQKGIVHRDLKPGNILVTMIDGKPIPKVIDFGVAKATSGSLTDESLSTQFGAVIGTLEYMSPEQAGFSNVDVDTRADVYSLGVVLYELLTGLRPFDGKRLKKAALDEMIRIIREEEPSKPSTRLSTDASLPSMAAIRHIDPKKLTAMLRGELDWVVMKCLEKQRDRRYETANGLARDIQRYLADETVEARPASAGYRLSKFLRRNRGMVGAASAVAMALLIGLVAFAWQAKIAQEQRDLARDAEQAEAEQRRQAVVQRDRAIKAEEETKKRADELQQVSDFQARMLSQVNPTEAGKQLTADVMAKFEAAQSKSGASASERTKQVQTFSALWKQVNATDAALALIDGTILKPAVTAVEKQFENQPVLSAQLQVTLAKRYFELGLYDSAFPVINQAVATRKKEVGEDHPDTLEAMNVMTTIMHAQGKWKEAEPIDHNILQKRRSILGEEHPDTLTSINAMGFVLEAQNKLKEAEPYYREALEKRRRIMGEENKETLISLSNFGELLSRQGKFKEAEPYAREALDKCRRALGEENMTTIHCMTNLGVLLVSLNQLDEAEKLQYEAVEKNRRVLGEDHPNTLRSINNLGALLRRRNKMAEAEPLIRESLEKHRRVLGENHIGTISSLVNYGTLLQSQKKFTEAEPVLREAMEKSQRVLGPRHMFTVVSTVSLAGTLESQAKHAEAVKLILAIEPTARQILTGPNASRLGTTLYQLGKARTGLKEYASAETTLIEAHLVFEKSVGPTHPETRTCIKAIIDLYTQWNAAEPGKGYDTKADTWKKKFDEMKLPGKTEGKK